MSDIAFDDPDMAFEAAAVTDDLPLVYIGPDEEPE